MSKTWAAWRALTATCPNGSVSEAPARDANQWSFWLESDSESDPGSESESESARQKRFSNQFLNQCQGEGRRQNRRSAIPGNRRRLPQIVCSRTLAPKSKRFKLCPKCQKRAQYDHRRRLRRRRRLSATEAQEIWSHADSARFMGLELARVLAGVRRLGPSLGLGMQLFCRFWRAITQVNDCHCGFGASTLLSPLRSRRLIRHEKWTWLQSSALPTYGSHRYSHSHSPQTRS